MNCCCVPPKSAVVRVSQNAKSAGKEYFTCPTRECSFFAWAGEYIPMSIAFGRNRPNNNNSKGSKNADTHRGSPLKVNGKHEARLSIYDISQPPVEIWLSMQCPCMPVVEDLFSRLPQDKVKYSHSLKMWLFSFSVYDRIIQEFLTPPFDALRLVDLPRFLSKGLASFQKKVNKLLKGPEIVLNLTPRVSSTLLPFQLETVHFVAKHGGRALLGDDMGCGKTLQAISCMLHYRQYWPVLIVVPSSLLKQWPDEILKYAGDVIKPADISIIGKSQDVSMGLITIITYKVMDNLVSSKLLTADQFGIVIADESHNLKNKDTSRSSAVLPFLKNANIALCMTGTPAVNRPVELYSQLHGLLPEVFNDYTQFVYRYCDAKPHKSLPGLNVTGSSNERELNILLKALVMIRRTKSEVLSTLPEKRREIRYVEPDPECLPEIRRINLRSKKLDELLSNTFGKDNSEIQAMSNEKQQLLTALYTVTGTSKIPTIREELVKLIEESRKERGIHATATTAAAAAVVTNDVTAIAKNNSGDNSNSTDRTDSKEIKRLEESGSAKYPILMELEDDIITITEKKEFIHDLCAEEDSDSDNAIQQRRKLNDSNKRKYKSIRNKQCQDTGTADTTEDGDNKNICSIFDLHKKGATKNKITKKPKRALKTTAKQKEQDSDYSASDHEDHPSTSSDSSSSSSNVQSIGQKIIVFFHHKLVLNAIEDALIQMQVKYIKIDGSTTQARRAKMIDQFQNDHVTDVALLSITACGTGLNLTRANVALFGELNWSLGVVLQAEDRIHRLGQLAKEVRIIYLIARNTVDEIVWEQIQRKHQVVGATVGTSESRSYGGGMKIAPVRDNNVHTIESYMPVTGSRTEQATAVAGFEACASSTAALVASAPPPPPLYAPVDVQQQRNQSGYPTIEPAPTYYTPVSSATAVGQSVDIGSAIAVEKAAVPANPQSVSSSYYPPVAPGRVVSSTSGATAMAFPSETQHEFSYSASTEEATETTGCTGRDTADQYNTARLTIESASACNLHRDNVAVCSRSSAVPAPASYGAAISVTGQGSTYDIQAPALNHSIPAVSGVSSAPPQPAPIVPKPSLAPEVLARIQANRAAALAKLAAAKQRAVQSSCQHNAISSAGTVAVPSLPSAVPPGRIASPSAASTAITVSSPAQLQAVLLSRSSAVNVPPGHAQPPSAGGHVFSTARGKNVEVSEENIHKANALLAPSDLSNTIGTAATKVEVSVGPAPVGNAPAAKPAVPYGSCPQATLYFDGGSLGNPGKGGAGYQLFALNGRTLRESAVRMNGICTNNQAEYVGLIHGMTAALHCGVHQLTVYGDSEVVIKQMLGQYQVKNPVLVGLYQRASALKQRFHSIQLQWIPREKNNGADALSKKAMHRSEEAREAADWFSPS